MGGDGALVSRLQQGDEQAYEELVRTHLGRMLAVARRILRNEEDARDAAQDAFLQAFRNIGSFQGTAALGTWLHRITVNAALMRLRRQKARPAASIEELLPAYREDGHRVLPENPWNEPGEVAAERAETRRIVRELIDRLPPDYRTVLLLRDVEQLSTKEAAAALGIGVPLVKTRLHRARMALRGLLEEQVKAGAV